MRAHRILGHNRGHGVRPGDPQRHRRRRLGPRVATGPTSASSATASPASAGSASAGRRRSTPTATSSRRASSTATRTWTPRSSGTAQGANSCWHGVTTAVMGNCGFTLAPVHDDARALVVRNLERAEDIDPVALAAGIDWSWRDVPRVPRRGRPPAEGHQLRGQHRALRAAHLGDGRARVRATRPTDDDLARMEGQLEDALARRRDRLHDVAERAPRDVRRPSGGLPARGVGRGRASSSA